MELKRFAAFLIGVGVLAALPWAWTLGVSTSESEPSASYVSLDLSSAASSSRSNAQVESPAFDPRADRTAGDITRKREASERWRHALVDPGKAPPQHYTTKARFAELEPRMAPSRIPTEQLLKLPDHPTGTLVVKFRDEARVRLSTQVALISRTGHNVGPIDRLIDRLGLRVEPAFFSTEEELMDIETRAAEYSGRLQPDLAGFIHLTGPKKSLVQAAQVLNEHHLVEFVEFEEEYFTGHAMAMNDVGACCLEECPGCLIVHEAICGQIGGAFAGKGSTCAACGTEGACCVELPTGGIGCVMASEINCAATFEGYFQGLGTICEDEQGQEIACSDFEPECGACGTGGCLQTNPTPYCEDEDCCELVCGIDPWCCDEVAFPGAPESYWDDQCAEMAHTRCGDFAPPGIPPACLGGLGGPCFEANATAGCSPTACCAAVCNVRPSCCDLSWDAQCVQIAFEVCPLAPDDQTTPDFTIYQGYLTPGGYFDELGTIPSEYVGIIPLGVDPLGNTRAIPGFGGQGYDIPGLEWLGNLLLDKYGIGNNPDFPGQATVRGESIRVGVVEHSAFVDWQDESNTHEDLRGKVQPEPNQTVLKIPGSSNLSGDHGTASLGVIGAMSHADGNNGVERGMVGLAPEAELYFFPIVSAEEGGRFGRAMISAIQAFGAGDVLSFSIGPSGCGTLASGMRSWTLLRMAADSGITCVISAGNDCCNLDQNAQAGALDSDVVIVGAVFPGCGEVGGDRNCFCRLGFSNYCTECGEEDRVHVGAWGMLVATLGYGALFVGDDDDPRLRSYTHLYNGTSAAAPQVAAIIARLQSFSKQFYGIPITPNQIRGIISSNGTCQCGICDPTLLPGSVDDAACLGSWDPQQQPDRIGSHEFLEISIGLIDPRAAAESIVESEFFTCDTLLDEIHTIHGDHLFGNVFSACSIDGNYYVSESRQTSPGDSPANPPSQWLAQTNQAIYNVAGNVTDVLAVARVPHPTVLALNVTALGIAPPGVASTFVFIQIYDWDASLWTYAGATSAVGGGPFALSSPPYTTFNPQRFVRSSDGAVLVRVWGFAFNNPAGPTDPNPQQNNFQFQLDWIDINILHPGAVPLD